MAERIVSPGVFTKEIDQSFLPQGIGEIGAVLIGPTIKGPAQIPTKVQNYSEFEQIFGGYTEESYLPFTAKEYLDNAGTLTVTRLLYEDGYKLQKGALAVIAESGSARFVSHILHPTVAVNYSADADVFASSSIASGTSGSFSITISGSYSVDATYPGYSGFSSTTGKNTTISSSINNTSNDYIEKIFGQNPKSTSYPVYVQYQNENIKSEFNNLGEVTCSLQIIDNYEYLQDFQSPSTPFITSQKISGTTNNLFKIHALSHGTGENYDFKIGIQNIITATENPEQTGFGKFDLVVRAVNNKDILASPFNSDDTDVAAEILETYNNLNLNPDSPRYISKVIGDVHQYIDPTSKRLIEAGTFDNNSKYIRVEVTTAVENKLTPAAIPFGFRALTSPILNPSSSINLVPSSNVTTQNGSSGYNENIFFGFDFQNLNNLNYLSPIPTSGSSTGSNSDFYLGDMNQDSQANFPAGSAYSGSIGTVLDAGTIDANIAIGTRKFILPIQGGFDGARPNLPKYAGENISSTNTFGFDCSSDSATGTTAYKNAFNTLSNTDQYDFNMLITPGVFHELHPSVTNSGISLCETRADAFYVMDPVAKTTNISNAKSTIKTLNSSYVATYYPWVLAQPSGAPKALWVPPSVVVPSVLSFTDRIAHPWFAPAGLNRGGLAMVKRTYLRLSQSDRDELYENRINPIANFPNEGVCIWGQKTLQALPSALDRVNVRRLLITVKKFIASATRFLVFEQNTSSTRNRFLSIVNPYLQDVVAQSGLSAFRVIMDETNNTPDVIDQNQLVGQLFLQPTRTAEFIVLDFTIQPTGASFPD